MTWPFLVLDALFLAGLVWWLWQRQTRPPKPRAAKELDRVAPLLDLPVKSVRFEASSARLDRQGVEDLDRLGQWLKANRQVLELTGSADDTGNPTTNRKLAQARAAVAQRALLAHGVQASRLVVRFLEPQRGFSEAQRQELRCTRFREVGTLPP